MTAEEHKAIVTDIMKNISAEGQAAASELLTKLSEDYTQQLTIVEDSTKKVTDYEKANEELRKANMSLFLKVGQAPEDKPEDKPAPDVDPYANLFDENGNLK